MNWCHLSTDEINVTCSRMFAFSKRYRVGDLRERGLLDHGPWIQKGLEHRDPSDARVKPLRVDSCVLCHVRGSHFPADSPREDKCLPGKVQSERSLMAYWFFPPIVPALSYRPIGVLALFLLQR